jgi:hypothetical protein
MNLETTIVLAIVMLACTVVAVTETARRLFVRLRWPLARAIVLRYRLSNGDGGRFYHPVYRFTTGSGRQVTAISSWGSWRHPWQRGKQIAVRHDPSNPKLSEIQCFGNDWGLVVTCLGLIAGFWIGLWWLPRMFDFRWP